MKKFVVPPVLALLLLFSCRREEKMIFQTVGIDKLEACLRSNEYTIFCYFDSTRCTTCSMEWLTRWTHFNDELKSLNAGLVLIVRNSDEDAVYETMTFLRLFVPVVFDTSFAIKKANYALLRQSFCFTVNSKKEVVWIGLPIKDEKSWNEFCKTLRKSM